jgi:hypothetical protein
MLCRLVQHVDISRDTVVYDEGDIGTEMCHLRVISIPTEIRT